jgi:hypothetical protein
MPMKELTTRRAGNEQQERVSKRASGQRSNDHVEETDIQHGRPRRLERTGHSKDDPEAGRLRVIIRESLERIEGAAVSVL